jgi:hypothetical protein
MTFTMLAYLFSVLLDLLSLFARSEREKDLEILLLRQQIRILQRTHARESSSLVVGETATGHAGWQTGPTGLELPCSVEPQPAPIHA